MRSPQRAEAIRQPQRSRHHHNSPPPDRRQPGDTTVSPCRLITYLFHHLPIFVAKNPLSVNSPCHHSVRSNPLQRVPFPKTKPPTRFVCSAGPFHHPSVGGRLVTSRRRRRKAESGEWQPSAVRLGARFSTASARSSYRDTSSPLPVIGKSELPKNLNSFYIITYVFYFNKRRVDRAGSSHRKHPVLTRACSSSSSTRPCAPAIPARCECRCRIPTDVWQKNVVARGSVEPRLASCQRDSATDRIFMQMLPTRTTGAPAAGNSLRREDKLRQKIAQFPPLPFCGDVACDETR